MVVRVPRADTKSGKLYFIYIISRDGFLLFALRLRDKKLYAAKMAYLQIFDQATDMLTTLKNLNPKQQHHIYTALHHSAKVNNLLSAHDHTHLDNVFAIEGRRDAPIDGYAEMCAFFNIPPMDTLLASDAELPNYKTRYYYPKITARPRVNAYPNQSWLTPKELLDSRYPSPLSQLLKTLAQDGHNVDGRALEWKAIRYTLECLFYNATTTQINCEEHLRRGLQVVWP